MTNILCNKVYYDNVYGYRYIVRINKNNIKTLTILTPYNNCWLKTGPFTVSGPIHIQ